MLRALRVIGILVFALLVGLSARRIQTQYDSGKLFEQYNSERKANVTLLSISVIGLGLLGFFEAMRPRRRAGRIGFAPVQRSDEPIDDGLDTANIYSAPKTDESWHRTKVQRTRTIYKERRSYDSFWLGLLQILVVSLPVVYGILVIACLGGWILAGADTYLVCWVFFGMLLLAALAAWGIRRKKGWGLKTGYAVAILHLLFFPVGTAVGLILLIALVGASPSILLSPRERRRAARGKKQQNLRVA